VSLVEFGLSRGVWFVLWSLVCLLEFGLPCGVWFVFWSKHPANISRGLVCSLINQFYETTFSLVHNCHSHSIGGASLTNTGRITNPQTRKLSCRFSMVAGYISFFNSLKEEGYS
ncbi:hypothetical protein RRG08_066554, partial [Elysia crispata]